MKGPEKVAPQPHSQRQHTTMAHLSHDEIQTLLSTSAHDPAACPQLEAYVRAQVSAVASPLAASESPEVRYSFDANRTLIKLYQSHPHLEGTAGMTLTALAAFLALLRFPDTDFLALGCLIPERVQAAEPCATLVRCAELLERCQFAEFWPEFRRLGIPEYGARDGEAPSGERRLLSDAVNGPTASHRLRASLVRALARTYRTAPLPAVLAALDLQDADALRAFVAKVSAEEDEDGGGPAVEEVAGDVVTFAASAENTKRGGSAYKEGVGYDDVAAMMATTALRGQ